MEEQLKARLIGAVVLVVIAVLLIPELLSGRKATSPLSADGGPGGGTRTITIDIGSGARSPISEPSGDAAQPPTQSKGPSAAQAPLLTQPPPEVQLQSTSESPSQSSPSKPAPSQLPPQSTPEPAPTVAVQPSPDVAQVAPPSAKPAAASPKGGWTVQVGAFGSAATARKMVGDLSAAGFNAYVSPISRSGKTLHRVRVGHPADRPGAEQLAAKLKGRGLPATVVAND
jgi:DedD protein